MDPNFQLDANEERIAAMIGKDAILEDEESEALDENQAVPEGIKGIPEGTQGIPEGTQGVSDGTADEGVDDTEGDGGISELCRMVEVKYV